MFRSMQPLEACCGRCTSCKLPHGQSGCLSWQHPFVKLPLKLPKCVVVHTGSIAIVSPSAGSLTRPKPLSLFALRAVRPDWTRGTVQAQTCRVQTAGPAQSVPCQLTDLDAIAKGPTMRFSDSHRSMVSGCYENRKSRVTLRSTGAQADNHKPAGWGFCVFEMAPGDSSAGLGRLKPTAELYGPVVSDFFQVRRRSQQSG